MVVQDEIIDKSCCFYVSDFHLEMMLLPEINKKIEEKEEIIILTQKNLNDTLKVLISKMNLKEENKQKILNLNWDGKKEKIKENSNIIVIGSKEYIKIKNKEIENLKIKSITDCYNFEETKDEMNNILENYKKQLNTLGNNKF